MVTEGEQLDQSLLLPLICLLQLLLLLFWLLLLPYCLLQHVQESWAIDPKLRYTKLKQRPSREMPEQHSSGKEKKKKKDEVYGQISHFGYCHLG